MKRVLLSLGLSVLCLVVASSLVFAGVHDQARFALNATPHFTPTTKQTTCQHYFQTAGLSDADCLDYTVDVPVGGSDVWVTVGQLGLVGITGVSFGVDYVGASGSGIDPNYVSFEYCGDGYVYGNSADGNPDHEFPWQGGGVRITWSTCQNTPFPSGVQCTVGMLYVYAYDAQTLRLTSNNNLATGVPELAVTKCGGGTTDLIAVLEPYGIVNGDAALGKVGFGNGQGYNPCGVVPTAETTWGQLKSLYKK
jgi:hypothetical protein